MEGLTSPAKEVSTGSGSTIHPTAGKGNSANFAVTVFSEVVTPAAYATHYISHQPAGGEAFSPWRAHQPLHPDQAADQASDGRPAKCYAHTNICTVE